jgi:hypothetical protein
MAPIVRGNAEVHLKPEGPFRWAAGKPPLTSAEIQAKKNALQALTQTLPAALYPCVTLAAGTTLLAPTPLGLTVGPAIAAAPPASRLLAAAGATRSAAEAIATTLARETGARRAHKRAAAARQDRHLMGNTPSRKIHNLPEHRCDFTDPRTAGGQDN